MEKALIKVVICDDHIVLRDGLASLVNSFDGFTVVGTAGNGKELITLIENTLPPDLIILDVNMPEMDGYDAAEWMHKNRPEISILALTMFDAELPLIRLLQRGVKGFLKKDVQSNELKTALGVVAEGEFHYSASVTQRLAGFFRHNYDKTGSLSSKSILNDIEIEFLRYASTELTYKEIAEKMGMTARAVDGYRNGLFERLNIKSRVGLAIYAVKNGIINF